MHTANIRTAIRFTNMEINVINLADKQEYTIYGNKSGENAMICPVCSMERKKKTDKCFSYNYSKGAGRCNHCQVVLVEKKEFTPKPTDKIYTRPLFKKTSSFSQKVIDFFTARKISERILLEYRVGEGMEWMPQCNKAIDTIQFNYFLNGELINIKYRGQQKSFKLVKDAELIFYNIDCAIEHEEIIIVEGEMDCLAMAEAGYRNCISVPNGAGLGKINFEYLDNCIDLFSENTKFILAVDNDLPGMNLQKELARRLGYENCSKVTFKDCKDANDCLIKYGIQGIIESIQDRKEYPIVGAFTAIDFIDNIYKYYNEGLPKGCDTGFSDLDQLVKFHTGYITTITGIPGHGKSEWLDFILARLNLRYGWKGGIFSPENHPLELHFSKLAEKFVGKPFDGTYYKMTKAELDEAITHINLNFYFIKPAEDFSLDSILDTVKMLVRKKGIKYFVIDAWNKLDHKYTDSETKYISQQLDKISIFCEKYDVHCFLVAHPTKISKDKVTGHFDIPNLYSINGSANFFNKTSNGITVYINRETGNSEIYVQKVKFKHWGATGSVIWKWNSSNGRYFNDVADNTNWLKEDPADYSTYGENINNKQLGETEPF